MKPWRRFTLILLAYGIALLHTAIPHHHSAPSDGRPAIASLHCVPVSSVGNLLTLVFSTDLGKGHLEIFQKSDNAERIQQFAVALFVRGILFTHHRLSDLFSDIALSTRKWAWDLPDKIYQKRLLYSVAAFRAPPAFM